MNRRYRLERAPPGTGCGPRQPPGHGQRPDLQHPVQMFIEPAATHSTYAAQGQCVTLGTGNHCPSRRSDDGQVILKGFRVD